MNDVYGRAFPGKLASARSAAYATIAMTALLLMACSSGASDHERTCRHNMKVVVHSARLWNEYRVQSMKQHQKENQGDHAIRWRPLYVPIGGFIIRYGENKTIYRPSLRSGQTVRNDVFVMKDGVVVAQIVDYIAVNRSIDGPTGYTCLIYYDGLVIGKRDAKSW